MTDRVNDDTPDDVQAEAEMASVEAEAKREEGRRELGQKGIIFGTLISVLAVAGGGVVGFVTTLAIVVLRARSDRYVFGMDELARIRWETMPILVGMAVGVTLALLHPKALDRATVWGLLGVVLGAAVGYFLGGSLWGAGEGQWAGAIVFGGAGLLFGGLASLTVHRRHEGKRPLLAGGLGSALLLAGAAFVAVGFTSLLTDAPLDLPDFESIPVPEPSNVDAVVFLLGDAGATIAGQSPLLPALRDDVERWSAALARDSAVSVVFLGDLVYPVGVRDHSDPCFETDSMRLWNQIDLVGGERAVEHASTGLFLAGNHDWGNVAGEQGFDRMLNLGAQIDLGRRHGRHVSLHPPAGEPGPTMRDLRRNVRVIFIDTHWFLQARSAADKEAFFERLEQMIETSGDREVILAAHHPYRSAGPHGAIVPGYHAGGVAYLLKKSGTLVQDLNSPVYDDFLRRIRTTFERTSKPPLVFAGGHDHSLQVLQGGGDFDPRFNLVSGAGSKISSIGNTPGLAWGAARPGYMMLVFRKDDAVDLFVVAGDPDLLTCEVPDDQVEECMSNGANAFEITYSVSLLGPSKQPVRLAEVPWDTTAPDTPWRMAETEEVVEDPSPGAEGTVIAAPAAVSERVLAAGADTVTTTPGKTYPGGRVHRFLFGDLNRHLWRIPLDLPVLDLDRVGGGLDPIELTGGKQTIGVRFRGSDRLEYDFRAIVKDPSRALPEFLRTGAVDEVLDDQMAAQFPLAALVVSELEEAAGILAPRPVPAVMPNDGRLGEFRSLFAGRVGLLTINAEEGPDGAAGYGGYDRILGTDEVTEVMAEDPESSFDAEYYLQIRMIDFLVGDWDRHSGQWRWAARNRSGGTVWRAIPEDRDWAFVRIDGVVNRLGGLLMPKYVGFTDRLPSVTRLAHSGYRVDHRVMNGLDRDDFLDAARHVQAAVTDSVIDRAVSVLPAAYLETEREPLTRALKARRLELLRYAADFYQAFAKTVHVYGFDESEDVVEFERITDERVIVRVRTGGEDGVIRFERLVDGRDTDEVRMFIGEEDRVIGDDDLPFDVVRAQDDGEHRDY